MYTWRTADSLFFYSSGNQKIITTSKLNIINANMYKYDSLLNKIGFRPFSTQYLYGFERFFCMNISKIQKCFFPVKNINTKIYFFELLIHIEYSSYRMRKLPFSPMAFFYSYFVIMIILYSIQFWSEFFETHMSPYRKSV